MEEVSFWSGWGEFGGAAVGGRRLVAVALAA
jgi:hypothetical protein